MFKDAFIIGVLLLALTGLLLRFGVRDMNLTPVAINQQLRKEKEQTALTLMKVSQKPYAKASSDMVIFAGKDGLNYRVEADKYGLTIQAIR